MVSEDIPDADVDADDLEDEGSDADDMGDPINSDSE